MARQPRPVDEEEATFGETQKRSMTAGSAYMPSSHPGRSRPRETPDLTGDNSHSGSNPHPKEAQELRTNKNKQQNKIKDIKAKSWGSKKVNDVKMYKIKAAKNS